jgi:hypothetical protein
LPVKSAAVVLILMVALGCSSVAPPTAAPSIKPSTPATGGSASSSVPVDPEPASCWAAQGSYQLVIDGSDPTQGELSGAERIVTARLRAAGLSAFEVTQDPPDRLDVAYGQAGNLGLLRGLVTASGVVEFVPVPAGESIEPDALVDEDWQPLFDGSGVTQAVPGMGPGGQETVDVQLTDAAGALLDQWARTNLGSQLAIVLDGRTIVAPSINAPEFGGQMQISGGPELLLLAVLLRQPPMPGRLDERSFDETTPSPDCGI